MKLGFPPNYHVRVDSLAWSLPDGEAALHEGTYRVDLNRVVVVTFVDDLAVAGPPWSADSLPEPGTDLTDPVQARLSVLLSAVYAVTPNAALAGRSERFERPWAADGSRDGAVFYTGVEEFAVLRADLEELGDIAGGVHSVVQRDTLIEHPVIRFLEDRVLDSPWLRADHAEALGRDR
ncbi:hypothetical protein [Actinoplanes sp. NBRC 101535]|uniref:hypothetical protein n=1 Tax=Actinoplanes sp. NBRC 101535 TaxID=3032196 RepID=UPI0024A1635C|nr:hypothetical protein [Actinoplanes sp. NBRC 101535]GLY01587.1 hypothetical protein Acsp01_19660 [Actinoplanes sp. NBRC 101535]